MDMRSDLFWLAKYNPTPKKWIKYVRLDANPETGRKKVRVMGKYWHGQGSTLPTGSTYEVLLQKLAESTDMDMRSDLVWVARYNPIPTNG